MPREVVRRCAAAGAGALRVDNTTDLSAALIAEVFDFAVALSGHRLPRVELSVRNLNLSAFCGHAHVERRPLRVVASMPTAAMFRRALHRAGGGGPDTAWSWWLPLGSREEVLVFLVAHEVRHLIQGEYARPSGRVWGSRGRYSERDCDAFATRVLRAWRRRETSKGRAGR